MLVDDDVQNNVLELAYDRENNRVRLINKSSMSIFLIEYKSMLLE